ncbi:MAG TPA: hypothetical protein VFT45_08655 [Longimicrobium sp.]|nr:hypothetical protein [Longimicrobium sp.]
MPLTHPNAFVEPRPLTAARMRELLATLRERGGDLRALRSSRAHGEDFERLWWLWQLTGDCWSGAADGLACARARVAAELRDAGDPAAQGVWALLKHAWEAQARQLASITEDELAAVEALAGELRTALQPAAPAAPPAAVPPRRDPGVVRPEDPEAREWLAANGHPAPLAANRFDEKPEAEAFVETLYEAGAVQVVVAADCIRDDEDERAHGGPYADGLRVRLPAEPQARRAVLAIINREAEEEGFDPYDDAGQDVVFLWWD